MARSYQLLIMLAIYEAFSVPLSRSFESICNVILAAQTTKSRLREKKVEKHLRKIRKQSLLYIVTMIESSERGRPD